MLPLLAAAVGLCAALSPTGVRSMPAISGGYRTPCSACHLPFPRLNAVGLAFQQNGYRRPAERGAPPWAAGELPFSLIAHVGLEHAHRAVTGTGGTTASTTDRVVRDGIEIQGAGTLADRLSFALAAGFPGGARALRSRRAFVQLDDLLGAGALNLRAGLYDIELPFLSQARRTTLAPYLAPVSRPARGLELDGAGRGWSYAGGVVGGERDRTGTESRLRGLQLGTDTYLWMSRAFEGQRLGARIVFGRQNSDLPQHAWLQHLQGEAAAALGNRRAALLPAYVLDRYDDRPAAGIHDTHHIGTLEALLVPDARERWALTLRYEIDHRRGTRLTPQEDHRLGVVGLGCLVKPNARLEVEWSHASESPAGRRTDRLDALLRIGV